MAAMIEIDVRGDMAQIRRDLWMVSEKHARSATLKALNRTAATLVGPRSKAVKEICDALGGVKPRAMLSRIKKGRANYKRLSFPVYVHYKGLNLVKLGAKQNASGVYAMGNQYDNAFMLKAGHVAKHSGREFPAGMVFVRKHRGKKAEKKRKWGEPELPIEAIHFEHRDKSIPIMEAWIQFRAGQIFVNHFNTAMEYALQRSARAA